MKLSIGRIALLLTAMAMMITLSGCTVLFTLEGSDSYVIMPNGDIFSSSMEECEIEIDVNTEGSILRPPAVLSVELEGLLQSMNMDQTQIDAALETMGQYLETALGFSDHSINTTTDTFFVTGEYALLDFWSDLGITGAGTTDVFGTVPLSLIIGLTAYESLVDGIVHITTDMTPEASSIDFEMEGLLKTSTGKTVGTFILWLDSWHPIS